MSKYKFEKHIDPVKEELHKRAVYNFPTRAVISHGVADIFSVDLIDMNNIPSGNFRYILNAVDVASRKLFSVLMKSKDKEHLKLALIELFHQAKPKKIWSDQESALLSNDIKNWLHAHNVIVYHTFGAHAKSAIVERLNRTMRSQMVKNGFQNWHKFIPQFVKVYNETIHSSIGVTPNDAWSGKDEGQAQQKNLEHYNEKKEEPRQKFNLGDRVRVQVKKNILDKKTDVQNWSTEIFIIDSVLLTNPTTYKIKDSKGEIIQGGYYAQELQKTAQ